MAVFYCEANNSANWTIHLHDGMSLPDLFTFTSDPCVNITSVCQTRLSLEIIQADVVSRDSSSGRVNSIVRVIEPLNNNITASCNGVERNVSVSGITLVMHAYDRK